MDTILNYLTQQSTWKGIIAIVTAGGIVLSPDMASAITATGLALVGLINVFRNEHKAK